MRHLFVAGTDTEVGKTLVSALLTAGLNHLGLKTAYIKPVASDGQVVDRRLVSPDAIFVKNAANLDTPWELLNPVCLPGALAPLAAAEAAGHPIDPYSWRPALRELEQNHDIVLIEGVGGLLVPITDQVLALDLVSDLKPKTLLVGRPGLGTINHTLLSLETLERRGFEVLGFCYSQQNRDHLDISLPTNARHTSLFTRVPFLGEFPYIPGLDTDQSIHQGIMQILPKISPLIEKLAQALTQSA